MFREDGRVPIINIYRGDVGTGLEATYRSWSESNVAPASQPSTSPIISLLSPDGCRNVMAYNPLTHRIEGRRVCPTGVTPSKTNPPIYSPTGTGGTNGNGSGCHAVVRQDGVAEILCQDPTNPDGGPTTSTKVTEGVTIAVIAGAILYALTKAKFLGA